MAVNGVGLLGDKQAGSIVLLKAYNDYYYGYNDNKKDIVGYYDSIYELKENFPIGIELYQEFRRQGKGDSENVNDDIVFEMELIEQILLVNQYKKNFWMY